MARLRERVVIAAMLALTSLYGSADAASLPPNDDATAAMSTAAVSTAAVSTAAVSTAAMSTAEAGADTGHATSGPQLLVRALASALATAPLPTAPPGPQPSESPPEQPIEQVAPRLVPVLATAPQRTLPTEQVAPMPTEQVAPRLVPVLAAAPATTPQSPESSAPRSTEQPVPTEAPSQPTPQPSAPPQAQPTVQAQAEPTAQLQPQPTAPPQPPQPTVQPQAEPTAPPQTQPTLEPTEQPVPRPEYRRRADAVLARMPVSPASVGFTITFHAAGSRHGGLTWTSKQHIDIYIDPSWSDGHLAHVIAHEIGHALDLSRNDRADRDAWRQARGIDQATSWWSDAFVSDFGAPSGDFAECFAAWAVGAGTRSHFGSCAGTTQLMGQLVAG